MNKGFYKKLVDTFGNSCQMGKCLEELVELQQVILWELNNKGKQPKFIREKLIEEMSDVLMTFESLKLIYFISEKEINQQIKWKEAKKEKEIFGKEYDYRDMYLSRDKEKDYIRCMKCNKLTDIVVRINPKGKIGIFWCEDCAREKGITLSYVINEGKDKLIKKKDGNDEKI